MKRATSHISSLFLFGILIPLVLTPSVATAHLVTTGMGPVYDGIGHLLLTPEDLLPALGAALYAGMLGPRAGRQLLFLFPLGWLAGGITGLFFVGQPIDLLSALILLILGALIATDMTLSIYSFTLLAITMSLLLGFFNGLSLKDGPGIFGLIGISVVLFVLMGVISALVVSLKRPWTRIVLRVSGSWMMAIGLLMVGWYIRGYN